MAALLCFSPLTALSLQSSTTTSVSKLCVKPVNEHLKLRTFHRVGAFSPVGTRQTMTMVVKASADVDGITPAENSEPPSETKNDKVVPVDKLPLESKQQELAAQKLKMKMAKKIRLRRKRLVRKRHLRKKGRWPPSKMKKLKNV
ncbi:hypothetical protein ACFE04_031288 [Oxalis oulophora]